METWLGLDEEVIRVSGVLEAATSCHCVQLIPIIPADLVLTGELLQAGPGLSLLLSWWQEESRTTSQ